MSFEKTAMQLVGALTDILGDICDQVISVAEFLCPPLKQYLVFEIDTFGPLVPEWCSSLSEEELKFDDAATKDASSSSTDATTASQLVAVNSVSRLASAA
ncbi:hypothetical protein FI667_g3178, partial [Globisporangium splendens]